MPDTSWERSSFVITFLLFFSHHIVNAIDVAARYFWEKHRNMRKKWGVLIETSKDILRREAPDVVLINGTYSYPWMLAQAAHELGIPIVLRYAGVLQKEITHKPYFVRRRLLAYEQWIASAANAVIFPSTLCRTVVEDEITESPIRHGVIIPNPVSVPMTLRAKKLRKSRHVMAAIGRWTAIKNFQAFLKLHEQLTEELWPHRAIMVTSFWDERFGITETIERREQMGQEELQTFYQSIDLLVVPSHFETFCNVAAEALMQGCSVLVSDNVGFSEVLRQAGLERMVIPSFDDPTAVAEAVKKLSKTKLTKTELKAVTRILDPQEVHEHIVRVLEQVVAGELAKE